MSMPERIWAGFDYPIGYGSESFDSKLCMWDIGKTMGDTEYVRADIVDAKDAEIERLRKAMGKAEDLMTQYANIGFYGWLMTQGSDCDPTKNAEEALAYLRERVASSDNRPPDSGVQSGVQNPEEGGKSA